MHAEESLVPDTAGSQAHPPLPCHPVPPRASPLGSQKGCRRQGWRTAGWVGAGSQLGPVGRAGLSWHLVPLGELAGASSDACGCEDCTSEATLLSQHLPPILYPASPAAAPYRRRARPPGCPLVWSHRHPHVAALPRNQCQDREDKRARPEPSRVHRASQRRPARHLKGVVKLAGPGERVPAVSALSHVCNCGLGRPCPPRPCAAAAAAAPGAPSAPPGPPARLRTDWPRRPEGPRGSPQRRRVAPAPRLPAPTHVTPGPASPPADELQLPAGPALGSRPAPPRRDGRQDSRVPPAPAALLPRASG